MLCPDHYRLHGPMMCRVVGHSAQPCACRRYYLCAVRQHGTTDMLVTGAVLPPALPAATASRTTSSKLTGAFQRARRKAATLNSLHAALPAAATASRDHLASKLTGACLSKGRKAQGCLRTSGKRTC